jgi:hypothetical protein
MVRSRQDYLRYKLKIIIFKIYAMFFVSFYHLKKENVPHCSVSKEKFFKNGK